MKEKNWFLTNNNMSQINLLFTDYHGDLDKVESKFDHGMKFETHCTFILVN